MADESTPKKSKKDEELEDSGIATGLGLNLPFSNPFWIENSKGKTREEGLQELRNTRWGEEAGPTVAQLVAMRRMDGQARALYRLLTRPLLAGLNGAEFIPAEGGDKEAEFITNALTLPPEDGGMTVTMQRFMSQLLQALFDGFAPFEKVYHVPVKGKLKGKQTLKKLLYLPVATISFITDDKGGFRGFHQRASFAGKEVDAWIEPQYAVYYAAQEEENPFYGVSFFQSAFYHYDKKMKSYFLAHLAAQRAAVGTRVGSYPANATKQQKLDFMAALDNLAFAQYMAFPEGFTVELLKEGTTFDFLNYINHHNSQMSKSILAAFFDESQGSGSNDNAMIGGSGPGDDWFFMQMESIRDEIASVINQHIIPDLIDNNFSGSKYPKFKWGVLGDDAKKSIRATFEKLAAAGQSLNITPEFMREIEKKQAEELGLDIDYDDIEKREKEDADRLKEAGIDPKTGAPFPQPIDPATGQPMAPPAVGPDGAPAASEDQMLDALEEQAVALTAEAGDDLISLARALLDDADLLLRKDADRGDVQ